MHNHRRHATVYLSADRVRDALLIVSVCAPYDVPAMRTTRMMTRIWYHLRRRRCARDHCMWDYAMWLLANCWRYHIEDLYTHSSISIIITTANRMQHHTRQQDICHETYDQTCLLEQYLVSSPCPTHVFRFCHHRHTMDDIADAFDIG